MSLLNSLIPSLSRESQTRDDAQAGALGNSVKPVYEIKETADAYGVTVYLPGVTKDGLDLTAEDGAFRIVGRRAWKQPAGWTALYRESTDAPFELVLTHLVDSRDPQSGVIQRYNQIAFELVDAETGGVVWSGMYEFQRAAADDVIYR